MDAPTTPTNAPVAPAPPVWTCPFCSLLCDTFGLDDLDRPRLRGSDCPRARAGLAHHARPAVAPAPWVDGAPASWDDALAAAAGRLAQWHQPLFGGLGTDVAGARALCRLALRTGAIVDHADGATLLHGMRAVQDRGQYTATLSEVHARAELMVCVGTPAIARFPEFFRRIGLGGAGACRRVVFLGAAPPEGLPAGVQADALLGSGDLHADVQRLGALVAGPRGRVADPALAALADDLLAAAYSVLVWEAGALPGQGALIVEGLNRIVDVLNRKTRSATCPLGGSDGGYTAQQVITWLTGLPLRTRAGPAGLEHEPVRFATARLVADRAVDGVLWVSSFDPTRLPPAGELPRIVMGPPVMAEHLRAAGRLDQGVFLPVATPGIDATGHLFRTDIIVVVPLQRVRDDGLPGVAELVTRLGERFGERFGEPWGAGMGAPAS